jgi:Na+-translocating ferredoxin:NAD+ oxidoreductase RNF subunit RnfB
MIEAFVVLVLLGAVSGAGLAIASKKFVVVRDPKLTAVLNNLPGTNCGACGLPGCSAMAAAIVSGKSEPAACPVNTDMNNQEIGKIIGVEVGHSIKQVARLLCGGDNETVISLAKYEGFQDCNVMAVVSGGGKACIYGCMGGGTCVKACIYSAMQMNEKGLPIVFDEKCVACGLCVKACPRKLMKLLPVDKPVFVACSTKDKGADVRKICKQGCISCKICEKTCPVKAITLENNILAVINPSICEVTGICIEKCPTKAIRKL